MMEEKPIIEIKGMNGQIKVFEDYIILSRNGITAKTFFGFKGERTIYYKDLSAIEYKKPSFFVTGYFQFIFSGTEQKSISFNSLGKSKKSLEDENTVAIRGVDPDITSLAEKVNKILQERLKSYKSLSTTQSANVSPSLADEIAKLAELKAKGLLDDEEFIAAKQKLLKER